MFTLQSKTLNKVITLNKVQERELAKLPVAVRESVAQSWLQDNEKRAIASEERYAPIRAARQGNKDNFSVTLMESGLLKITGLGVGRPAFLSKAGAQRLVEGIAQVSTVIPSMPESPSFPRKG